MIKNGEIIASDKFSSIYFKEHYDELLDYIERRYSVSYPTLKKMFKSESLMKPESILKESLELMDFLLRRDHEMPRAYFFAVFPRDFNDIVSLILGGSSSIKVPLDEGLYEFKGGFGYAFLLKNGRVIKELSEGDEMNLGIIRVKVFSRSCYDIMEKPLKTLVVFSLLAKRRGAHIRLTPSPTSSIIWRSPQFSKSNL